MRLSRRSFLKWSGVLTATASLGALSTQNFFSLQSAKASEEKGVQNEGYEIKYTCDVMCPAECGLEMWVKDGRLVKIYGNKAAPLNFGGCCAKGVSGLQLVYSPERLKYPMIREGNRGEGKFRRVSWEEAIDYIAKKLVEIKKKYGPEAVIMDSGDVTDRDQYWRLFYAYGTPHCTEHGSICDTPRRHGPKLMLNGKRIEPDIMRPVLVRQPDGSLKQDYSYKTRLIIYVGWNPFVATRIIYENRGTVGARVENGCKVVVVDPAHTNTAAKADLWLPIRPGTDPDLFAAMLRFILEHDNPLDPQRRYIDWEFIKKYTEGWEEFRAAFTSWWSKVDPVNNLNYFSLEWAADRTGLPKEKIAELAHMFGSTKPAALVWGMQSPGHHYNGYVASILGTALNAITGNLDVPGGAIDTEIVKSNKGGSATGKQFNKRKVKRIINGKEVEAEQEYLHMDLYGDWPAAWDDAVADYPRRFLEGVTLRYGPFRGHRYPIKGYILRTGNTLVTGSNPEAWKEALTAKEADGNYKVELFVVIDTLYLESALYADVILPEASFAERMSLSDIYPSHPMLFLRDQVIQPLHESKTPTEIMNLLARRLYELGDTDIKPGDFWEKYRTQEDFVNEMLKVAPGRPNVGQPLPYPNLPEGYVLYGTPDSLEEGRVTIDHEKKEVRGEPVTVEWLRKHNGVVVWPMSWYRYRKFDPALGDYVPNGVWPPTKTKKVEFHFYHYDSYNKKIDEAQETPPGLKAAGFDRYPSTFYWFETQWNPHTNPKFKEYAQEYPFQLITGRVHHAMTGTQMLPWLGQVVSEGLWMPMNREFEHEIMDQAPKAIGEIKPVRKRFRPGTWSVGTILMNIQDGEKLGLKTGDLVEVVNPLGHKTRGQVFLSHSIRPGVIKIGFGTGGRFSPGLGATYKQREYTPNHNALVDPRCLSPIMGFPCFADMMVKVVKI